MAGEAGRSEGEGGECKKGKNVGWRKWEQVNGLPEQNLHDADPQTKTLADGCHSSQRRTQPTGTVYGYLNKKTRLIS